VPSPFSSLVTSTTHIYTLSLHTLFRSLNSFLPNNIAIHNLFQVHPEAHARFHALSRAYVYRISLQKDVFNHEGSYYFKQHLDVRSEEHTSELQSRENLVCRLLLEKKNE